jgi:hypothetical protein
LGYQRDSSPASNRVNQPEIGNIAFRHSQDNQKEQRKGIQS